ncbi:hypothetical protein B566_EDAN001175 [Ephemera danica]|nr:hypothetical protein B566_EDAN001175 [Ephemera danica]
MGKKKNQLGHTLVKSRFGANSGKKIAGDSLLHTSEINDGQDFARLNLQSVTEESSFQEFLSTAELAGKDFKAEKLNASIVTPSPTCGLLTEEQKTKMAAEHELNKDMLKIPRRPFLAFPLSATVLHAEEEEAFLKWRRSMVAMEEANKGLILTPYERNIEVWRELWRTVGRSYAVIQVIDARNPLLFRSEDLELYVKQVDPNKDNILLLNKADLLTEKQREAWAEYFSNLGIKVGFFSALLAAEEADAKEHPKTAVDTVEEHKSSSETAGPKNSDETTKVEKETFTSSSKKSMLNSPHILTRKELIKLMASYSIDGLSCVGFVGYPNVGKSSTINALMKHKKVAVSSTPGKTKHMQSLYVNDNLMVCDCPGLVMPSFVFTKAEMVINGILPVDQLTEARPPVQLIAKLIPRHIMEEKYGLMLPVPNEFEDPNRAPTAEEVLNAYGYNRGFMTQRGLPDTSRSARYIIKDFIAGTYEDADKASSGAHVKGIAPPNSKSASAMPSSEVEGKPWKRHNNRNKKQKLRRVYAHLDQ